MPAPLPPAFRAASEVLQGIAAVVAPLVGLSVIAYVVGLQEADAYFSSLGAPWVAKLLGPTRLLQFSSWVVLALLVFAFASVHSLAEGSTHRKMHWSALATLLAGAVALGVARFATTTLDNHSRALFAGLGAILFAVSSGYTFGEVIATFKEAGFRWSANQLFLLFSSFPLAFWLAPRVMGDAHATLVIEKPRLMLPTAELSTPDAQNTWYLLEVVESAAVLVQFPENSKHAQFRVVALTEVRSISSTKPPGSRK